MKFDTSSKRVDKSVSKEASKEVKVESKRTLAQNKYGTVTDEAKLAAKVEAKLDGKVNITSNGVDAAFGVKLEAKAGGEYNISFKSKEFTINGQKLRADFSLSLSAAVLAKAEGKVELGVAAGPPPKAIVKV